VKDATSAVIICIATIAAINLALKQYFSNKQLIAIDLTAVVLFWGLYAA
jgi:hypothetical protein